MENRLCVGLQSAREESEEGRDPRGRHGQRSLPGEHYAGGIGWRLGRGRDGDASERLVALALNQTLRVERYSHSNNPLSRKRTALLLAPAPSPQPQPRRSPWIKKPST